MGVFGESWTWLTDPEHWQGEDGIPHRLLQHLATPRSPC